MDFEYAFEKGKDIFVNNALPLVVGTIIVALAMGLLKK